MDGLTELNILAHWDGVSYKAGALVPAEVITGSIARSAKRRYLRYSEADFELFSPRRGVTLH